MIPEKILQSDLLDILFENRNKYYGAYFLRRNYSNYLLKAIATTTALSILFFLLLQMRSEKRTEQILTFFPDDHHVTDVFIEPDQPVSKPAVKQMIIPTSNSIDYDNVKIVQDSVVQNIADVDALEHANISNETIEGDPSIPTDIVQPFSSDGNNEMGVKNTITEKAVEPSVLNIAEIMPAYPGGIAALKRFMERYLVKPDNLQSGETVVIKAKFVVSKTGEIEQIALLNDGPSDLKQSVLKTIAKMPNWSPGIQNGHPVAVYFVLPITFMATEY